MSEQTNRTPETEILQLPLFSSNTDDDNLKTAPEYHQPPAPLKTLVYLLAIASVKGIGFKTLGQMFDAGLLWDIWDLSPSEIVQACEPLLRNQTKDIIAILVNDKNRLLEYGEKTAQDLQRRGITFTAIGDKSYPLALNRLQEPPRWLFIKGQQEILHSESIIALVGTRKPSPGGMILARRCAEELAIRNFVVLSGLARGIDENAHLGAVNFYGQSIAVLGQGLELEDTYQNKALVSKLLDTNGAIVSEYLPGDPPSSDRFLRRNELVAALAKVVIPVESPTLESGTGATIRRAIKINTRVLGITHTSTNSKTLAETKSSLASIKIPVFTLGNGSEEFWNELRNIYPNHGWDVGPQARQELFFRQIIKQVVEVKEKISLDAAAIDRLTEKIKQIL